MDTTPCRGCGKPIVFGETSDGKNIPLDPRPPCYQITEIRDSLPIKVAARRNRMAMVSHFATCPKASEFSGSKK